MIIRRHQQRMGNLSFQADGHSNTKGKPEPLHWLTDSSRDFHSYEHRAGITIPENASCIGVSPGAS